jgi:hypothetical protein
MADPREDTVKTFDDKIYDDTPAGQSIGENIDSLEDLTRSPFSFDKATSNKPKLENEFDLQIGVSLFSVPPQSMSITEVFTNTAASYPLRSKTSSKASPGQSKKQVKIKLIFPNLDALWGSMDPAKNNKVPESNRSPCAV